MKRFFSLAVMLLVLAVALAACRTPEEANVATDGEGTADVDVNEPTGALDDDVLGAIADIASGTGEDDNDNDDAGYALAGGNALADLDELLALFPLTVPNMNSTQTGGTFRWGLVGNSPFVGILLPTHSRVADDGTLQGLMGSSLISTGEDLRWGHDGILTWEHSVEDMTLILTMRDDIPTVYWHDGVPFTLDDLLFAYEIITHPDYTGIRNTGSNVEHIYGAAERMAGETEELAGATLSDDGRQLTLRFVQFPPNIPFNGLWMTPVARHHWGHIPIGDLEDHPYTRNNPLGIGPFILENFVPGEAYHFVANPNYWQGAPLMDGVVVENIGTALAPLAMQEGQFDMMGWGAQNVVDYAHLNNINVIGQIAASGTFQTFRLGYLNRDEDNQIYFTPRGDKYDNPIQDPLVRHAIGHALDQLTISMSIGNGLSRPATSVLWPFNARHIMDTAHVGHAPHNPDLANQLLDEAGLTARDSEGYRLDFNGNPWTFRWSQTPGQDDEIVLMLRQDALRQVGIRMRLWQDEFVDWNYQMDHVQADTDEGMDIFSSGWSFGWAINPASLWGNANFNFARWASDEWLEIQENLISPEAWDPDFYAYWVARWEQAFYEAAVALPVSYGIAFTAVNRRVANVDITRGPGGAGQIFRWSLTADAPYAHQ